MGPAIKTDRPMRERPLGGVVGVVVVGDAQHKLHGGFGDGLSAVELAQQLLQLLAADPIVLS